MNESERITELQAEGTRLVNELRMWKARAEAAEGLLHDLLVEFPLAERIHGRLDGTAHVEMMMRVKNVAVRIALLEADAHAKGEKIAELRALIQRYVEDAKTPMGDFAPDIVLPTDKGNQLASSFVSTWEKRFSERL